VLFVVGVLLALSHTTDFLGVVAYVGVLRQMSYFQDPPQNGFTKNAVEDLRKSLFLLLLLVQFSNVLNAKECFNSEKTQIYSKKLYKKPLEEKPEKNLIRDKNDDKNK